MTLRQEMEYHAHGKESVAACAHKAKTTESKQRRLYLYKMLFRENVVKSEKGKTISSVAKEGKPCLIKSADDLTAEGKSLEQRVADM